jgi:hypothetical protein
MIGQAYGGRTATATEFTADDGDHLHPGFA